MIIQDASVFEIDLFKEGSAKPHDVRTYDLIAEAIWIDNSPAIKGG